WQALAHHEWAAHHLRVQAISRLQDRLWGHRTEMVCGQRGIVAIDPQGEEGCIRLLEVESDRETICRHIYGTGRVQTRDTASVIELGVEHELPGEGHVAGIVGLPIRPHQTGSQVERPG